MRTQTRQHVIIVGAGPVGLVTANLLADEGVAVSLVETCTDLPRDLRASTFHPRTLDMLDRFGVVAPMIEQGLMCPTWQFRDRTEGVVAAFELSRLSPDTNYPYRLQCERWRLAELLYARLKNNPLATIRLGQKAVGARQKVDGVELDVRLPDGGRTTVNGTFLVGADGIGSIIRSAIGALFDGITIPELFLTLSTTYDFREAMPDLSNISYLSDPREWYVLIRTTRVWRVPVSGRCLAR
jgi:3-(3-hydroxy-phenyl)propionate hydroxylase